MAKVCQVSGKRPSAGNNVSHSVRRTKRRFLPNLQKKRVWDPINNMWIKIRICTRALRSLMKEPSKREQKQMERRVAKQNAKNAVAA